ncbi:MAG: 5-formyltetrahydrofolate cyclo-ligase [Brevinema sp.]
MIKEYKQQVRNQRLLQRRQMNQIDNLSREISHLALPLIRDIDVVAFYYSINQEPNLQYLWEQAWEQNKIVLLPRVVSKNEIVFCPFSSLKELKKGAFDILEPCTEPYQKNIDLIFVPGLAFGRDGSRLGYGAGYYDRFLKKISLRMVGVCYAQELQEFLPKEEHDIMMDAVITEQGIHYCGR